MKLLPEPPGPLAHAPGPHRVGGCHPCARPAAGPRGLLAGALAAAGSWLLEPAEPEPASPSVAPVRMRPVIAVFGLARGCGVTVVSRALAAELARRDVDGAAAVHCDARTAGIPLATRTAADLARALADVPGADTRAVGRLCLVGGADQAALADTTRHFAPLVLDAGSASLGGVPAALADRVVLVATPTTEPALTSVAADCLARVDRDPIVVLNRAAGDVQADGTSPEADDHSERSARWAVPDEPARKCGVTRQAAADPAPAYRPAEAPPRRTPHRLPDSRMGAQLALGGREPRGELGRAIAELADLCEAEL
jgi:hypothetical protein